MARFRLRKVLQQNGMSGQRRVDRQSELTAAAPVREKPAMSICVAGATGLVGRHVVEALTGSGRGPIVATFHNRAPYQAPQTRWLKGDLVDQSGALAALGDVDTAILCAGRLSTSAVLREDPVASILESLRIGTNLLQAASKLRLQRVILISSCTVYPALTRPAIEADMVAGDPPEQWFGVGWMHRYLEQQLRWHVERLGTIGSGVSLRPTLVYGPYDDFSLESAHFVPALIRKVVERARPIEIWGDGRQTRNLLHAADLAGAILSVLDPGAGRYEVFNVSADKEVSVNETVGHLIDIDGFSDASITHVAGKGGGPASLSVSASALIEAKSWQPRIRIRDGLAETLAWYRRNRDKGA